MSVFGGDSWAREAQQRKRRVEDLIGQGLHRAGDDSNPSYKKLCNGKYACLVCPHHPVLDTTLMLSMHNKGSCHIAAQSRRKEKESKKQEEIRKRIALSDSYFGATCSDTHSQQFKLSSKPLIEQTRKATSEALCSQTLERNVTNGDCNVKSCGGNSSFFAPNSPSVFKQRMESPMAVKSVPIISTEKNSGWEAEVASRMLVEQQLEFRERRERELKFTAAGWKRDCHGKWFRDENVEFDSDEEDPNVCLT